MFDITIELAMFSYEKGTISRRLVTAARTRAGRDVRTVVWATGFRPDYSWLDAGVFDRKGELKHDRGVVDAPGLYVLGLPYLRRRAKNSRSP